MFVHVRDHLQPKRAGGRDVGALEHEDGREHGTETTMSMDLAMVAWRHSAAPEHESYCSEVQSMGIPTAA